MNAPRRLLRVIESRRLTLVAATADLVAADLAGAAPFAEALGADVPDEWPPELFGGSVMRAVALQLAHPAEQGWSVWYLLDHTADSPVVIGMCQFKGRPDASGSVECSTASAIAAMRPRPWRAWSNGLSPTRTSCG